MLHFMKTSSVSAELFHADVCVCVFVNTVNKEINIRYAKSIYAHDNSEVSRTPKF